MLMLTRANNPEDPGGSRTGEVRQLGSVPTPESPVLGWKQASSKGGRSVEATADKQRRRRGMTPHCWSFGAVVTVDFGCTHTHPHTHRAHSRSQWHSNESRRTLLRREVGPSAKAQLLITHTQRQRSKSEEIK